MPPGTQEPSQEDVLAEWMRAGKATIHTCFPAVIVVYDPALQKATIQPVLRCRIDDVLLDVERPDASPALPIHNVPIVWPSGNDVVGQWSIHGPLAPGDPVWVVIAERSTDIWRTTGAPDVAPLDARRFDLSDAFAIPGGRHFAPTPSGPLPITATDVLALVVGGTLVKLGDGPLAINPLLLTPPFLAALGVFLAAVALDTVDSPVTAAAASALGASTRE